MSKVFNVLRNELYLRIGDETLRWIDEQRGRVPRSAFVRSIVEATAQGTLPLESTKDVPTDAA